MHLVEPGDLVLRPRVKRLPLVAVGLHGRDGIILPPTQINSMIQKCQKPLAQNVCCSRGVGLLRKQRHYVPALKMTLRDPLVTMCRA
jgi:hypothetical protein